MGAAPRFALLSLVLPPASRSTTSTRCSTALPSSRAMHRHGASPAATSARSPGPLVIDVTATGTCSRRADPDAQRRASRRCDLRHRYDRRRCGRPGCCSSPARPDRGRAPCVAIRRHQRPEPRLRLGCCCGRNRAASACMDLSDGLADAVRQIARSERHRRHDRRRRAADRPAARDWFDAHGRDPVLAALSGGDDYELLFTVSKKLRGRFRGVERHAPGVPLTRIGELTAEGGVRLARANGFEPVPEGFTHF